MTKTEEIQQIFAEITRYPLDILEVNANLEEDLGIDSVKLGEVFSVLREKYDLPEDLNADPDDFSTIAKISALLQTYVNTGESPLLVNQINEKNIRTDQVEKKISVNNNTIALNREELFTETRKIFAEVTRYPENILEPDANFEEDLGIDSVKLGEVFSVLREKYDLPEQLDADPDDFSTISKVTDWLHQYLEASLSSRLNAQDNNNEQTVLNESFKLSTKQETIKEKSLDGKIVFISGSGRGLGKNTAIHLANLGARVIVNSFHSRDQGEATAEEIRKNGGDAHHIWGSMANIKQLNAIFDEIEERYNGLDFFISNASNGMLARLEDITPEHWEKAYKTNIIGLHMGSLRARELMKKHGGGKIITYSSPAAHGYVEYFGCMGPIKAGVEALTKALAIEFAEDNIQINCVSPGPLYGSLLDKWPESERLVKKWENSTAYHRLCEAQDVSNFVAFLLSDSAKLFTGSMLVIDGGISSRGF